MKPIEKAVSYYGSQAKLAEAIGRTQANVSQMYRGEVGIDADTALLIHKATNGEVTAQELAPQCPWDCLNS